MPMVTRNPVRDGAGLAVAHACRLRGPLLCVAALAWTAMGCRVTPVGDARVYATSGVTDEVVRLDPRTGDVVSRIPLDPRPGELDEPHGIAVSPTADFWYATVAHGEPTLWKFHVPSDRLVGRVRLGMGGAGRIGITPDGRRAFVPDFFRSGGGEPSNVAVVSLYDLTIETHLRLCPGPHDAAVEPGGTRVAITCSMSDEIVILDVATLEVTSRFPVDASPGPAGEPRFRPLNVVWAPAGNTLFVTLHTAGLVRAFTLQGQIVGTASGGAAPAQIAITSDGRSLVVPQRGDGTLSVVRVADMVETTRIALGVAHPHGVAVTPDGGTAFVAYEGDVRTPGGVVRVDLAESAVAWRREAGAYTLGIAYFASSIGESQR